MTDTTARFQPGRTYIRTLRTGDTERFQVEHITTRPGGTQTFAFGWRGGLGAWYGCQLTMQQAIHWTDTTPDAGEEGGSLPEWIAAAIRRAACDGDCEETEERCARTRIQPSVWHHGVLAEVSGPVDVIAAVAAAAAVVPAADRAALSARLWKTAEHRIVAEWICCEPVQPGHKLCAKGYAALGMVRSLLVDADGTGAPLLDAVLEMLAPATDRAALRDRIAALAEDLRYVLGYRGPDHAHEQPGVWDTSGKPCTHCARMAVARENLAAYDADPDVVLPAPADRAAVLREAASPRTLRAVASHLDARAVSILRPESDTYAEWQALAAVLRQAAAEGPAVEAQPGKDTETWHRTGGFDQHDDYRTDRPS